MVQRWLVAAVLLVGACGKNDESKPKSGGVPPACDSTTMTQSWAFKRAMNGSSKYGEFTLTENDLGYRELGSGSEVFVLTAHPCCDIPTLHLGNFWHCTRYEDDVRLTHDMLLDRGWVAADGPKRATLANDVDKILHERLDEPGKEWNPYKTFTPPVATPQPDGGVKLRRWITTSEGGGMDAPTFYYVLQERPITAAGELGPPTPIERYVANGAYADPALVKSCDPTKPPTKEWAYAILVDKDMVNQSQHDNVEDLTFTQVYEDVWRLTRKGLGDAIDVMSYFRHCQNIYDKNDLVPELLEARGWATAKPDRRVTIAKELDERFLHHVLATQVPGWDVKHPFKAPTATANADGSVTLSRWIAEGPDEHFSVHRYTQSDQVVLATGKLGPSTPHDTFDVPLPPEPGWGPLQPKTGSAAPRK